MKWMEQSASEMKKTTTCQILISNFHSVSNFELKFFNVADSEVFEHAIVWLENISTKQVFEETFFDVSIFEVDLLQCVRFWNDKFELCQLIVRNPNPSESDVKNYRRIKFWNKSPYRVRFDSTLLLLLYCHFLGKFRHMYVLQRFFHTSMNSHSAKRLRKVDISFLRQTKLVYLFF